MTTNDRSAPDSGSGPSRYTRLDLPEYRHLPGETPHPTRDPDGHSYGRRPAWATPAQNLNTVPGTSCQAFLYGLDLFNAGYWWECHEVLEDLWHAAGHGTPAAHTLQAVIQCCAARLKVLAGQNPAARKLLDQAVKHADQGTDRDLGLDLVKLLAETRTLAEGDGGQPVYLVLREDPRSY